MSMKCTYEVATGGSTRAVTEQVLSHYLESESLEGKAVLDNACGPGVVTKEILKRAGDVKIDAVDISTPMIEELRRRLSSLDNSSNVTATVMDAQDLAFPDNRFDLTITMMAIMYLPNPTKALEHLHRVTKPSGKCFITTWNATETKSIGETVLQRLQGGISTERPVKFWNPEMEDSEYLISEMQKVGFKECVAERKVVYATYPSGPGGVDLAMELAPVLLSRFIDFRDEEEHERYRMLWREEFQKRQTGQGLRIEMCANIVWGKK